MHNQIQIKDVKFILRDLCKFNYQPFYHDKLDKLSRGVPAVSAVRWIAPPGLVPTPLTINRMTSDIAWHQTPWMTSAGLALDVMSTGVIVGVQPNGKSRD